jgi:hypothetical protein
MHSYPPPNCIDLIVRKCRLPARCPSRSLLPTSRPVSASSRLPLRNFPSPINGIPCVTSLGRQRDDLHIQTEAGLPQSIRDKSMTIANTLFCLESPFIAAPTSRSSCYGNGKIRAGNILATLLVFEAGSRSPLQPRRPYVWSVSVVARSKTPRVSYRLF